MCRYGIVYNISLLGYTQLSIERTDAFSTLACWHAQTVLADKGQREGFDVYHVLHKITPNTDQPPSKHLVEQLTIVFAVRVCDVEVKLVNYSSLDLGEVTCDSFAPKVQTKYLAGGKL